MESLNVYGYCRESTRDQVINGFNMEDQEKKIKAYFDLFYSEKQYELIIMKEGKSGRHLKRPKFEALLKEIKSNRVRIVMIHNLDRLTRSIRDLGELLEVFERYNVQLISITERIDTTTPMGRFFVYLIVLLAQWEVDTISDRARRGENESARQGNYSKGGLPPLGFKRVGKKLEVDESEKDLVIDIFERIASGKDSVLSLQNKLRKNSIKGRVWGEATLWRILRNHIYYGTFKWRDYEIADHSPAIISKELFFKVQEQLKSRRKINNYSYIFKDKVFCKCCKERCIQHPTKKKNKTYFYYECPKCNRRINESKVEILIADELSTIFKKVYSEIFEKKLLNEYNKQVDIVNTLSSKLSNSTITISDFDKKIEKHKQEVEKLVKEIERYSKTKKVTTYRGLSKLLKKKFIRSCIYKIEICLTTKKEYSIMTIDDFLLIHV